MAIDSTIGGASSNSFISVADADTYMTSRIYQTDWDSATNDTKERALVTATSHINNLPWLGTKKTQTQSLEFPRSSMYDRNGYFVTSTAIPGFVENATCELAFSLVKSDRISDTGTEGFSSMKVGPLQLSSNPKDRKEVIPEYVIDMVRYYLSGYGTGMVNVKRS